jgi:hypothetical protein
MRAIVLSAMCTAALGACAVEATESVGEATQAVYNNDIFYDKFNDLNQGVIGGQAGWTGECEVVPYATPDKNLECSGPGFQNGRNAMHTFVRPPNRNYHLQFDVWLRDVTVSTHAKVLLEDPPGDGSHARMQIVIGCDNIRAVFEYHNGTTQYLVPPGRCRNNVRYRIACIWRDGGDSFRCGAAEYPTDPVESQFVTIWARDDYGNPERMGSFDRIRLLGGMGYSNGTAVFDKVQVLSD